MNSVYYWSQPNSSVTSHVQRQTCALLVATETAMSSSSLFLPDIFWSMLHRDKPITSPSYFSCLPLQRKNSRFKKEKYGREDWLDKIRLTLEIKTLNIYEFKINPCRWVGQNHLPVSLVIIQTPQFPAAMPASKKLLPTIIGTYIYMYIYMFNINMACITTVFITYMNQKILQKQKKN